MNTNGDEIIGNWTALDEYHVNEALKHLGALESDSQMYLSDYVATLCGITVKEMFSSSDVVFFAHSRWLYWYAYRYITNESYDKIARQDFHYGHKFSQRTIQNGVNKMAMMIEEDTLWKKRWTIIKRIIKLREQYEKPKTDNTIVIQVPKELRDSISIVIKEK